MRLQKEKQKNLMRHFFQKIFLPLSFLSTKFILHKIKHLQCILLYFLIGISSSSSITGCSNKVYLDLVDEVMKQYNDMLATHNKALKKHATDVKIYDSKLKKYNDQVHQLQEIINLKADIEKEHVLNINQMNQILFAFSKSVEALLSSKNPEDYEHSKELFELGEEKILHIEISLKKLAASITYNPYLPEEERQKKIKAIADFIRMIDLEGILLEHQMLWDFVEQEYKREKPLQKETIYAIPL